MAIESRKRIKEGGGSKEGEEGREAGGGGGERGSLRHGTVEATDYMEEISERQHRPGSCRTTFTPQCT